MTSEHTCFIEEKTGRCVYCGWQPDEEIKAILKDWKGHIYLDCLCFGPRQTRLSEAF